MFQLNCFLYICITYFGSWLFQLDPLHEVAKESGILPETILETGNLMVGGSELSIGGFNRGLGRA